MFAFTHYLQLQMMLAEVFFENQSQFQHHTKTLLHFTMFTFFPLLPAHSVDCIQNFINAVIFKSLLPQLLTEKSFSLPFMIVPVFLLFIVPENMNNALNMSVPPHRK